MAVLFESHLDEILEALPEAIEAAMDRCGQLAEEYARDDCPVDTGRLRDSIGHEVKGDTLILGAGAPYAQYVELGTHRMAPRPFLRPALEDHGKEYKDAVREALEG